MDALLPVHAGEEALAKSSTGAYACDRGALRFLHIVELDALVRTEREKSVALRHEIVYELHPGDT